MNSNDMKVTNQRSKYLGKSESFKFTYKNNKQVQIFPGQMGVTNRQKCLSTGIQQGTPCEIKPEDISIDFGEL